MLKESQRSEKECFKDKIFSFLRMISLGDWMQQPFSLRECKSLVDRCKHWHFFSRDQLSSICWFPRRHMSRRPKNRAYDLVCRVLLHSPIAIKRFNVNIVYVRWYPCNINTNTFVEWISINNIINLVKNNLINNQLTIISLVKKVILRRKLFYIKFDYIHTEIYYYFKKN